jgi:hypothetical protein
MVRIWNCVYRAAPSKHPVIIIADNNCAKDLRVLKLMLEQQSISFKDKPG